MHPVLAVAAAAAASITGTLNVPGYSAMALTADGQVTTALAVDGRFSLQPPAARVTLQLRAPDGTYAGPVVVGRSGSHVIVGVKAGAVLGRITFSPRLGYATARRVAPRWLDRARWARARGGVEPFGVLSMGRALSAPLKHPPPGDRDADGVPDVLDVDDDGDLVLDLVDPDAQPEPVRVTSQLVELDSPMNVDAGMSQARVDAGMVAGGTLSIASDVAGRPDCGALSWCPPALGTFQPHATSDQLRAGDVVIVGGAAGSVGAVFATVPAIASYTDDVGAHALQYPLAPDTELPLVGAQVRFELWRPQRRAMPADELASDEGRWVDMGGLPIAARAADGTLCPADAYSAIDPVLVPFGQLLVDQAPDTPAGQGGTFGFTLDVARSRRSQLRSGRASHARVRRRRRAVRLHVRERRSVSRRRRGDARQFSACAPLARTCSRSAGSPVPSSWPSASRSPARPPPSRASTTSRPP